MREKVNSSSNSSILSNTSLHDPFTDAEKEFIDKIVKELDTDDAKELGLCKAKLIAAEKKIAELDAKLENALHKLQLEEQASRHMFAHKQKIDLRNKMETSSGQVAKASKATLKDSHAKVDIVVEPSNVGLRRRSAHGSPQASVKLSLFPASPTLNESEKESGDDNKSTCFRLDYCGIS